MMMITDYGNSNIDFTDTALQIEKLGDEIGCQIRMQREEIFNNMHRI